MSGALPSTSRVESPFARALIAGGIAGTTADFSLYPIDTLKTRLQSSSGFYSSGGFRGIYAGVGSALIGAAPGAALFFVSYEFLKSYQKRAREGGGVGYLPRYLRSWSETVEHMNSAMAGELAACAVRVPTEVVKQRAQALQAPSSLAALRLILRRRADLGVKGVWRELYRGWGITVMRELPFTVIQFPLWEGMKAWRRRAKGLERTTAAESAVFGSLAGAVAALLTTPLDVLKTRMMLAQERQAAIPLLLQILRESGPRALFAGTGPRMVWISVGGAVFLGSYQWAYNTMAEIT
ncbi:S-adenosylmethionine transporter [Pseudocyphellaria aurata]|nr:S-adenosylmethionine transporter [Pseudocyphellaria aurata]